MRGAWAKELQLRLFSSNRISTGRQVHRYVAIYRHTNGVGLYWWWHPQTY